MIQAEVKKTSTIKPEAKSKSVREIEQAKQLIENTISKSEYASPLSAYANSLKRRGFIKCQSAMSLGIAFGEVCLVAEQRFEDGDYMSAINAACAVLEEAIQALQYTDDSSDSIGGSIDNAMEILNTIANYPSIDKQSRKHLLKYTIKSYEDGIFTDWDWHEDMLGIALYLVLTNTEKNKLRSLIQSLVDSSKDRRSTERSKNLMAKFLKATDK